jgi:hypothetical protein
MVDVGKVASHQRGGRAKYGSWFRRAHGARHDWRMTVADNPPSEIQTLIENYINAFNSQNVELFLSVFGGDAIIIDGIAPYRWLNPNAPANWLADVERWVEAFALQCRLATPFETPQAIAEKTNGGRRWREPIQSRSRRSAPIARFVQAVGERPVFEPPRGFGRDCSCCATRSTRRSEAMRRRPRRPASRSVSATGRLRKPSSSSGLAKIARWRRSSATGRRYRFRVVATGASTMIASRAKWRRRRRRR